MTDGYYGDLFESMLGKTLVEIINNGTQVYFKDSDGQEYQQIHRQNCCESCNVEDIAGDLSDLLNSPLTMAQVVTNSDDPPPESEYPPESYTWTYYKLATVKGYVTIRWFGSSNGYYSETATFEKIDN